MFKLIFFLIGLALTITFSALNLGNVTDLSLGFVVFKQVPVFLSTLIAFLAGAVFTLPFAFSVASNKKKAKKQKSKDQFVDDAYPADFTPAEPVAAVEDDAQKPE